MKIPQLIYAVIDKVSPMPVADKAQLEKDASTAFLEYEKTIAQKKEEDQKLNLLETAIDYSNTWWFRTIVALAYIPLIVWIQRMMNPEPMDDEEPLDLPQNERR